MTRNDAAKVAAIRSLLPTSLGTAGIRDELAAGIRANAVFSARCTEVLVLAQIKTITDAVVSGEMDEVTGRWLIREAVKATGYTPEGGFPNDPPGEVPPALLGTLLDLSSRRRAEQIIKTQVDLMRGRGTQLRYLQPSRLRQFPAVELVRVGAVDAPRNWAGDQPSKTDVRSRWVIAGGTLVDGGRMIAFKGDPIWGELGSSGNFDDALDVDHPPFAFNSRMGWAEVSRSECLALGITGPNGETIDEWLAMGHPLIAATQSAVPAPVISLRDVPAELVTALEDDGNVAVVDEMATLPGNKETLKARLDARRLAREARRKARVARAVDKASAAYQARGEEAQP